MRGRREVDIDGNQRHEPSALGVRQIEIKLTMPLLALTPAQ